MSEWYDGPYRVVPEIDELGKRPAIGRGDIIVHKSGAVILRCPACNAMQFARAKVLNSHEAPTLDAPVHCGSGHCKRCGVWFAVRNGRAVKVDEPKAKTRELPDKLKAAGVGPPRVGKDPAVRPRFRLKDLNGK